jgi:hypothetical protein
MKSIGVVIQKGPNAKPPRVEDRDRHKNLLREIYNAMGKPAPWENQESQEKVVEAAYLLIPGHIAEPPCMYSMQGGSAFYWSFYLPPSEVYG